MNRSTFSKFLKPISLSALALSLGLMMSSCSHDDDDPVPTPEISNGKIIKTTITVSSAVDNSDYLSFVIAGAGVDLNQKTIWKLNSANQENQPAVSLDDDDFSGNTHTYVIESIQPLSACSSSIQFINYDQNLTFSLKIEVDGEVKVNEQNKTLSGNSTDFTKQYSF